MIYPTEQEKKTLQERILTRPKIQQSKHLHDIDISAGEKKNKPRDFLEKSMMTTPANSRKTTVDISKRKQHSAGSIIFHVK